MSKLFFRHAVKVSTTRVRVLPTLAPMIPEPLQRCRREPSVAPELRGDQSALDRALGGARQGLRAAGAWRGLDGLIMPTWCGTAALGTVDPCMHLPELPFCRAFGMGLASSTWQGFQQRRS